MPYPVIFHTSYPKCQESLGNLMSLDFPEILVISIPNYEKFGCGVEILWRSKFTAKLTLTALYMSASRNFFTVIKFKIRSTGLNVFRGLKNSAIWPYL